MELTLNDRKFPVHFDCEAIENVCMAFGDNDINSVATKLMGSSKSMTDIGSAIKLARIAAFEGVMGGYRGIGEKAPFSGMTEFSDSIKNVAEIFPAMGMFAEAFSGLFVDTTKKKQVAEK
jgi:hypothetical protein